MFLRSTILKGSILLLLLQGIFTPSPAQSCNTLGIQWVSDISSTCPQMVMTMVPNANPLIPFLYVANKEAGLKIYWIANPASPVLTATVPTTLFDTLDVMSLCQVGQYVYLALGNSFTNPQAGGMAIVDVFDPYNPVVTDFFVVPGSGSGGGIVRVEGNYAYLGAMESGLVVLDVTDKYNIQFVSQFIPTITWPPVNNPNPNLYNARGMEVKNGIVYLCYDAGGIRIINCTNPSVPVETGRWCNPAMYTPINYAKAYNNCILDDTLLYVAVDYAGMEVLNVADTGNITMLGWWNPYNAPANNWFTSPVHANEMAYDKNCKRVFLSTGKSDMMVIDVANPTAPDSCNYYGGVTNSIGTWGISKSANQIYLSYICAAIPFSSNWTGVKILSYNGCSVGEEELSNGFNATLFPNPVSDHALLSVDHEVSRATITIHDAYGRSVMKLKNLRGREFSIARNGLASGVYYLTLHIPQEADLVLKMIVQ